MDEPQADKATGLAELAALFLKLGVIGFGGPAAFIAMMDDEVVVRRRWLSEQRFLDLVGATNLIPGPNATELAIHIGYIRRGWKGMLVAGASFVLPAVLIVLGFAWAYVRFGSLPRIEPFLRGVKPAVLAVILGAVWRLGRKAAKGWTLAAIGLAVAGAAGLGANKILALLGGGLLGMIWLRLGRDRGTPGGGRVWAGAAVLLALGQGRKAGAAAVAAAGVAAGGAVAVSLWKLGLFFLKVGCILYGTGYVLVAFLEADLVRNYHWLTSQQLLDAVAVGQVTPGPLFTTSTFIGYVVATSAGMSGLAGAAVATVAILGPSFVFVVLLNPVIPRLRRSAWMSAFLDAVNVSAVGLMVAVSIQLGEQVLTAWPTWLIAALAAVLALRWRVNTAWLVLGGAAVGWLLIR